MRHCLIGEDLLLVIATFFRPCISTYTYLFLSKYIYLACHNNRDIRYADRRRRHAPTLMGPGTQKRDGKNLTGDLFRLVLQNDISQTYARIIYELEDSVRLPSTGVAYLIA